MSNCSIHSGGKRTKRRTGKKRGGSSVFLNRLAVPATLFIAQKSLMGSRQGNSSNKTKRRRRKNRSRK